MRSGQRCKTKRRESRPIRPRRLLWKVGRGSIDADGGAEAFADRPVEDEVGDTVESGRLAFLITIVSRLCINHLQSARVQREEYVGQWLPEPLATDPGSDPSGVLQADESLSMAFLVMLERLTPVERAVFLLREIFDHEYSEIAATLGRNEANCRQILRRARQHVRALRPRFRASVREQNDLLERFRQATDSGDMDRLKQFLSLFL